MKESEKGKGHRIFVTFRIQSICIIAFTASLRNTLFFFLTSVNFTSLLYSVFTSG